METVQALVPEMGSVQETAQALVQETESDQGTAQALVQEMESDQGTVQALVQETVEQLIVRARFQPQHVPPEEIELEIDPYHQGLMVVHSAEAVRVGVLSYPVVQEEPAVWAVGAEVVTVEAVEAVTVVVAAEAEVVVNKKQPIGKPNENKI